MPEVIASVPQLNLPTGHSSETDMETTDQSASCSSSRSSRVSIQAPKIAGSNRKPRRSAPRLLTKKSPLKFLTPPRKILTSKSKFKLQRALLTPSSSSTSLTTHPPTDSPSLSPSPSPRGATLPAPAHLEVVRQSAIMNFRANKSISQMDMKHARRTGNLQLVPKRTRVADIRENCTVVTRVNEGGNACTRTITSSQAAFENKMFTQNQFFYVMQEPDPKVASMKIYATIMLNAWRKRRDDVKRLTEQVNDLKRCSTKNRNQIHVLNTLFRVEQKRNDELSCQLKQSQEDIKETKNSCASLSTSISKVHAVKGLLEQKLESKDKEFQDVNAVLSKTKSELFQTMAKQRILQAALSKEQRQLQLLETQNRDLITELSELSTASLKNEDTLLEEMRKKKADLSEAQEKIEKLEAKLAELKKKESLLREYAESSCYLRKQVESLKTEIDTLQTCLAASLSNRFKACWHNSVCCQKAAFHVLHWAAFCVLPATPPPEIPHFPIKLLWGKVMSVVKQ